MLRSPINQVDEFGFFSDTITKLATQRPADIPAIFKDLNEKENKSLREMLQTKRIATTDAGSNPEAPREARMIMRAKRRTAPRQQ